MTQVRLIGSNYLDQTLELLVDGARYEYQLNDVKEAERTVRTMLRKGAGSRALNWVKRRAVGFKRTP